MIRNPPSPDIHAKRGVQNREHIFTTKIPRNISDKSPKSKKNGEIANKVGTKCNTHNSPIHRIA